MHDAFALIIKRNRNTISENASDAFSLITKSQ